MLQGSYDANWKTQICRHLQVEQVTITGDNQGLLISAGN